MVTPAPFDRNAVFAAQFRTWWPYAGFVVLGAVFGGIGLFLGVGGSIVGLLFAAGLVVGAAWLMAGTQQADAALRAWGAARGLVPTDRAVLPGSTRLLRGGTHRHLGVGASGSLAGGAGGVCFYEATTGSGDQSRTSHITLAWTTVPPNPAIGRLAVTVHLAGQSLGDRFAPDRVVELESVELGHDFTVEVDDAADDVAVRALMTPALIGWCLDQREPGLWVEIEGRLLLVATGERTADPAVLGVLVARLERVAAAWRAAAPAIAAAG